MRSSMSEEDWIRLAEERLSDLVGRHLAVHWLEVEARLSEGNLYEQDAHQHVHPHILAAAKRRLIARGLIIEELANTRGGGKVRLLMTSQRRGRATAVDRAAARKRLLAARYLSWAQGSREFGHGLIGPAAEAVVRRSIVDSGSLRTLATGAGEVRRLLGVTLSGSLDSGGLMVTGSEDNPGPTVAVAIEVKSIRDWVYPNAVELYQLLDKAAQVQAETVSETPVLPVLVCRRSHYTTHRMAKQLGFFVIALEKQYLNARSLDPRHIVEVRSELGLIDLTEDSGAVDKRVQRAFREVLPVHEAVDAARRWKHTVTNTDLGSHFNRLRDPHDPKPEH